MAVFSVKNVVVDHISAAAPKKKVLVEDYDWITAKERSDISAVTGIKERRFATAGVCTSDMGVELCNHLFTSSGIDRSEIDLLVFVSQSRDYILPNTACIIQDRLKLKKSCMAFDVPLGCSGYVYGMSIVASMLSGAGGSMRHALLICGDVSSEYLNYRDKSTYPLFGDAVSATILSYNEQAEHILSFNLQTDGSGYEALIIPDCGNRNAFKQESLIDIEYEPGSWRSKRNVWMNGLRVFEFTIAEVALNIKNLLKHRGLEIGQIEKVVLHQANKLMNETVRKQLKASPEKVPYSLSQFGNTSSASIPLTIVTEIKEQMKDELWALAGFGVGLSWGSMIMNAKQTHILPLLEIDYEK